MFTRLAACLQRDRANSLTTTLVHRPGVYTHVQMNQRSCPSSSGGRRMYQVLIMAFAIHAVVIRFIKQGLGFCA